MVTTNKTADFLGRTLITPDSDARDYVGRQTIVGDRDYMGRPLSGGGGVDPETLLSDAAVRFDFSQYTDVDDMVDVNGGWGPMVITNPDMADVEFDAIGLRLFRLLSETPIGIRLAIEAVPSPLTSGANGITVLGAMRLNAPRTSFGGPLYLDWTADPTGDYAPEFYSTYSMGYSEDEAPEHHVDQYAVSVYDDAPDSSNVLTIDESLATATADDYEGMVVGCWTYDVPAKEVRVRVVTEAGVIVDQATPFSDLTPDFAAVTLDTIYYSVAGGKDITAAECLGWDSALSDVDVDALIGWFLP